MDDDAMGEILGELRDEIKELRQDKQRLREEADAEEVKPPAPPNDEIVESFFTEKNYADSSERPKRFSIKYYRTHLDDIDLRDATTSHALDFANNWTGESKPPKRATMLTYLGNIKVLYDWMMRHDWGPDENVVDDARDRYKSQNRSRIKRSGQHNRTVIKPEEYLQLVRSNMGTRAKSFLVLAVKTGLRRKELVCLKVQDIDLDKQVIYNRSPKGVGDVRVPKDSADQKLIDDETVSVLEEWLDSREATLERLEERGHEGRRGDEAQPDSEWLYPNDAGEKLDPMSMSRWWDKATDRAHHRVKDDDTELAEKFDSFTCHDARRCYTSWLNWNSCPRDVIQALRGDAEGDMVALYTQHGEDQVRREYEKAMPTLGL